MRDDCEACQTVAHSQVYRRGEHADIVSCDTCGLVWNRAMLTGDEQARYYSSEYRTKFHGEMQPVVPFRRGHLISMLVRAACAHEFLGDELQPGRRHLDVGCGEGTLLALTGSLGLSVTGLELDKRLTDFARRYYGLEVRHCLLDAVATTDERYDLVSLVHVIEHVAHPVELLRQAGTVLAPGGNLFIEVPNLFEPWQRPKTFFYREHSYYFSANSLRRLLALAGFRPIRIGTSRRDGSLQAIARPDAAAAIDPVWRDEHATIVQSIVANQRSYWLGLRYFRNKLHRLQMKRWAMTHYGHLIKDALTARGRLRAA